MAEQIIQKYVNLLSQKIYDCFYLESELENLNKMVEDKDKEIDRLKKILDENDIDYTGDEVSFSPVEGVNEE